ncbi:MAG: 50S ribosomal protein L29 [Candidatus Magasanikbacteria bacterium]|nr:50S ribosomal protein L29 [Candidatus Magasanikbacteria bacterium]MCA9391038.1 50S ribosomal protein L29 [Candidatus Magasanikbacteria bacterium]USN52598.1 MAG: 50S ribosomal protein L29 [Candidatus Nomurabacteria bacterium]
MSNFKELSLKTPVELRRQAEELRAELRDLRFKVKTRQYLKVRTVRVKRRELARTVHALAKATATK